MAGFCVNISCIARFDSALSSKSICLSNSSIVQDGETFFKYYFYRSKSANKFGFAEMMKYNSLSSTNCIAKYSTIEIEIVIFIPKYLI